MLRWNEPYWDRVTSYLRMAADHGITVLLYPVDGWTIGHAFAPGVHRPVPRYGRRVAERFADLPNIMWMTGGDYIPATDDLAAGSDVDRCWDAMMRGVRETGDGRPFSIQLNFDESISSDNPFWARRIDWNFVYTYHPTYAAVLDAYGRTPDDAGRAGRGQLRGREQPARVRAHHRRDAASSGGVEPHLGRRRRVHGHATTGTSTKGGRAALDPGGGADRSAARAVLEPAVVAAGARHRRRAGDRGPGHAADHRRPDGRAGRRLRHGGADAGRPPGRRLRAHLPHHLREPSALPAGTQAVWVDPTSGKRTPVPMSTTFTTPGPNDGGDEDWILLLTS